MKKCDHGCGATSEDQATLVLVWQATQGILDALLVTGLLLLPIGVIALGVAMLGTPAFGKGVGGVSVVIGVVGVIAGVVLLIDPGSPIAIVSVLSLIVFHIALGWKVYRLSRDSAGSPEDRGYTENGVRADGDSNPSKYLDAVQQGR